MTIGMEVVKYFRNHARLVEMGQGNITIGCIDLWDMSDEEFFETFVNVGVGEHE